MSCITVFRFYSVCDKKHVFVGVNVIYLSIIHSVRVMAMRQGHDGDLGCSGGRESDENCN
jgi:hypothetical protein